MPIVRNAFLWMLVLAFVAGCSFTRREPPVAVPPGPPHPADVVSQVALSMLGAPYRYGGSSPRGFDCSGLVFFAHQQAGIPVPRTAAEQQRHSRPIPRDQLRPGDLLFFDTSWQPGHVGIYVGGGEFVHAPSSGKRVSRASLRDGYFAQRLRYAGRIVDVRP
ncbi:MAG: C40 family peptidase [Pseudomonadales bacterium]|nr:C40 family peptidase [Pseudomonadales bacterium]